VLVKVISKYFGLFLCIGFIVSPVFAEEGSEEQPLIIDNSQPAAGASKVPKNVSAKMLDLLTRINQLETENRQLRGELELLTHDIKGIKHRQRELYGDIDKRIRDIELRLKGHAPVARNTGPKYSTGPVSRKPVTSKHPAKRPATTPIGSYTPPKAGERKAYKRAFALLRKNRFNLAISEFRNFLAKYPNGGYSDTAQYWLAEAYFASRKYKTAIGEFTKVIKNFPNSPKVAASRVKIGFCYYKVKSYAKARKALQSVMRDYPGSSSASLARSRLRTMRKEGR